MLNLELELIAILILTAVIGLLMGRFLCKSGESDEREKKKQVIHAFKSSQSELEISRERANEQALLLQMHENSIATHEQELNNLNTRVRSSDKQKELLLEELKQLEKYKPRFESLSKEFHFQSELIDKLKSERVAILSEKEELTILSNSLNKNISHLKSDNEQKEQNFAKLKKVFEEEFKKTIKEKDNSYETLKQKLEKSIQEKVNNHETSQEKLHREYKLLIKTKNNEYEALESEQNKLYKNMVNSNSETHNELKKELESITEEHEEFKINYHLDNHRLETLDKENTKIYHTLETLISERNDLLSRLRAISSVVGAVGVDKIDSTIPLLER